MTLLRTTLLALGLLVLLALPIGAQSDPQSGEPRTGSTPGSTPTGQSTFDEDDARCLQTCAGTLATPTISEWLGPLAPLALSPFFGVTCLSGIAMLSDQGVLPDNALIARAKPLKSPAVFATFLVLTLLTSLPRLTKLSKPVVQALDFVETWSVLIIALVVRHMATRSGLDTEVALAGFAFVSSEWLLGIIGAINMLVIATVRFVFEVLVWLSPFPFVDAAFEAANKTVCAGLMAIYAFHPLAALAVNLALFIVAILVFGWAVRQMRYFRGVLLSPILARFGRRQSFDGSTLRVFCSDDLGEFKPRERLTLQRDDEGLFVTRRSWRGESDPHRLRGDGSIDRGWLRHSLSVGDDAFAVPFGYGDDLARIAEQFDLRQVDEPTHERGRAAAELA